ncbi:tetratricopeptide repeat protein [Qipengyuania sp. XHP0207]|uniref:tetratricopeptide repeat protein n=1 Tax=Qipengyuania sp. XHP0207 TaxID=3038078 RepID=UPI00241E3BE7|nr:tetratricopeptide repeat protein [Qipengyuania sp. XHP0207]MDG5748496.1 tetratricopeptide repeat protein [Qipengyuania sp. XHP0207]
MTALAGCEPAPSTAASVELAKRQLAAGNPQDARIVLQRALVEGTPEADVAAYLGEAALQRGDLAEAARWLEPEVFSAGTEALGLRMIGRLEMARANLEASGRAYDRALRLDPQDPELWVDIGRLRFEGGEQAQAIDAAERALALAPQNASALQFRGQLLRDAEGLVPSLNWFAAAVDQHPANRELRLDYAATLADAGQAREALAVLRAGGDSVLLSSQGLFVQAVIAARGGRFPLARALLQRSQFDQEGRPAAIMLSAIVDMQNGNFDSAAQQLDRLTRRQPDNVRAVELLALALSRSGSDKELVRRFAARAAGPSGSPHLRVLVGRAYEAMGDRAAAARFLDLAAMAPQRLAPLPTEAPLETLVPRGGSGGQTRDYVRAALAGRTRGQAISSARDFVRNYPGSGDGYAILGDAELAAGDRAAARRAYSRAANIRQPWPLALRLAGSQATPEDAAALLERFVRSNPLNGHAAALLADAYAAQGKWSVAAQLLDHAILHGQARVPWVLSARALVAAQLGQPDEAIDFAIEAHDLQPLNPRSVAALLAVLPPAEVTARADLYAKLESLTSD